MPRLFVAIRPPAPLRSRLTGVMGGVAGARWQDDEQLHLTLRFIGEVDRRAAEDAALALGAVRHPRFAVSLDGLGEFARKGRVDSLWVGLTPHDALAALHRKVDRALVGAGLEPERRAYLPHITLARFNRGAGPLDAVMARARDLTAAPFEVADFRLYASDLGREAASYATIERYPLG